MKRLKPMDDKVVVEMLDAEKVTEGGIVLPDCFRDDQPQATVVAVGSGRVLPNGERVSPNCEPGDVVLLMAEGIRVEVGDKHYNLIDSQHVLAVVEDVPDTPADPE